MSPIRLFTLTAAVAAVGMACSGDGPTARQDSAACANPVGTLAVGSTVTGTLTSTSCLLADSTHADVWTMVLPAITTLVMDLGSTQFDAVLFVRNAQGTLVVEDDDSGPDFDSRITHTFAAGTYRVYANTYDKGSLGAYTLSAVASTP